MKNQVNLYDLSHAELVSFLAGLGEKPYRAEQIMIWLYRRIIDDYAKMSNLSLLARQKISENSNLNLPKLLDLQKDFQEGSQKMLWELSDGALVESVLMLERNGRYTICLSSQVGCNLGCKFCRTAELGFTRNLSSGEILGQFLATQKLQATKLPISNIVFMGMGEPLLNLPNVIKALKIFKDPKLLAIAKTRISVSTVGIVPELKKLGEKVDICLTISLSAATDQLRNQIMPINKHYPLKDLKEALLEYPLAKRRKITIAYVLLKGVNDSLNQAKELVNFLHGLKVKINLIPFNPWFKAPYQAPLEEDIQNFKNYLAQRDFTAIIRHSKGTKIAAACGQLAGCKN